ncbi:serum paraoxonase/arylesterase 2-like [Salarias fasciatus]|uniref:Paraoxonase n=1 Tax=Salarias fasciatus TaxID=181472 RepID=A0A672G5L1_SALFA|nr:serum paraoxonase/arylesterase 2-like [Salarias fasciatus]
MGKVVVFTLAVAALSLLLGERVMNLRKRALASRELVKKHLPNCVFLKDLENGSNDITILDDGIAFISTGRKVPGLPTSDAPGKIFYLDLQDPDLNPEEMRISGNFDLESFNPHGISLYMDPTDNKIYLFVINHPQQNSQVEVFIYDEGNISLLHVKTIKHELLHSLNDIVAVGVDSFYATNDHYFTQDTIMAYVEPFLDQPWCNVVFYSPGEVKVASEGYYIANGINISPDRKHIYVVDILDHKVHVLERQHDNSLASVKAVDVGSLCDNAEVDLESGDLWLGCHPNGWKAFIFDPQDPPGSEVIRIQNIHSDQPVVTQVYMDDGSVIIGSSVATVYGEKLLIGTVFHKALYCDLR